MSGPTLSVTEFATVTGVTRDRLRTWERRFGWPQPERARGGARRYSTDDAPRVVAVRRLQENGTPLGRAIREWSDPPTGSIGASTWRAVLEELPFPLVLLSGPVPLTVEYANITLRERPDGPRAGDLLDDVAPWFRGEPADELRQLFAAEARVARVAHPDWTAGLARPAHSLAVRVRQSARSRPLLALVGIEGGEARQTQAERSRLRGERARLQRVESRHRAWATAVRDVAVVTSFPGMRSLRAGLLAMQRRLDLPDVGLYVVDDGVPQLLTSLRGQFGPVRGDVPLDDVQLEGVRRAVWFAEPAAARIGAPAGHGVLLTGAPVGMERHCVLAVPALGTPTVSPDERDLLESCAHHLARAVP